MGIFIYFALGAYQHTRAPSPPSPAPGWYCRAWGPGSLLRGRCYRNHSPSVTCRQMLQRNFLTPSQVQWSRARTKPCLGLPGLGWAGQVCAGHLLLLLLFDSAKPKGKKTQRVCPWEPRPPLQLPTQPGVSPFPPLHTHRLGLCGSHHTRRERSLS